jgi:hypothetical protein
MPSFMQLYEAPKFDLQGYVNPMLFPHFLSGLDALYPDLRMDRSLNPGRRSHLCIMAEHSHHFAILPSCCRPPLSFPSSMAC